MNTVSSATLSNDGGFNFNEVTPLTGPDVKADGQRVEASIRLGDVIDNAAGQLTLYNQNLDAGYSSPGHITTTDTSQNGMKLELPLPADFTLRAKLDNKEQENGLDTSAQEMDRVWLSAGYHRYVR